jgi:hypothetical protein
MKNVKIIEGVIAEYNGKYWGEQEHETMDFGDIETAHISNPKFCKKPTDKTSINLYSDYESLSKAKLIKIKKTITTEFEVLT